jgi:error-prone DNA polymerase
MMGISEGEADRFRKSLSKHMRRGTMEEAKEQFVERTLDRHPDVERERAEFLWTQLESWGGYGFTEGHARSFALTGYKTANLSLYHPAAYFAGLMSNQPMGFYPINSLAGEARRRGVAIRPVDVNQSLLKCHAEEEKAIRLGLGLVAELRTEDVELILAARRERPFSSLLDFAVRAPLHLHRMENLILCGAFDTLHPHRRGLVWRLDETIAQALLYRASLHDPQARFAFDNPAFLATPIAWDIEDFSAWDKFLWTWSLAGTTAECHAFAHLREHLAAKGVLTTHEAKDSRLGARVVVAGMNIQPHRPPTKSGEPILFTSIEDEHGLMQATVVGDAIARTTATFLSAQAVVVRGTIVQSGRGVYLLVDRAKPLRMQEWVKDASGLAASPPPRRTYTGTILTAGDAVTAGSTPS